MLATLVIGLREGLEAALIVGIIAAFLKRNGKSLAAMWTGVGLALALSVAVGVGLDLFEQSLPQAGQEGMESVIGAVAIVFVTGMIVWMNAHARGLKKQLETEAADALGRASGLALASMAFLAVLREGFETSVFLLATFSAAQSATLAALGAAIGLLLAVAIGWGVYIGGVKLNLSRFFRITGAFLILVAAGLVVTSLRTAHEAGWLLAGQQPTFDLSWLVAPGSVQSALITGVLGIPADPRRIEVIGWLSFIIPISIYVYWPQAWRPGPRGAAPIRFGSAVALAIVALGLVLLYPGGASQVPAQAPLLSAGTSAPAGTLQLAQGTPPSVTVVLTGTPSQTIALTDDVRTTETHGGLDATLWSVPLPAPASAPASLTLDQVIDLAGGRVPVGLNARRDPGPFSASWSAGALKVWAVDGTLIDAAQTGARIVTLTGGGLDGARTISVDGAGATSAGWTVDPAYRDAAIAALSGRAGAQAERQFWAELLPIVLLLAALYLAITGLRIVRRNRAAIASSIAGRPPAAPLSKGTPHAAQ